MNHQEISSKGGQSRATKLSKQRLSDIARMASKARWARKLGEAKPDTKTPSISIPRRCQMSFCTNNGREVLVQGMKAWLCVEHG